MYRLWSEWDIDEQDTIFATEEAGMRWLADNLHVHDMARDDKQSVEEFIQSCFDDGLMGFRRVAVVQ